MWKTMDPLDPLCAICVEADLSSGGESFGGRPESCERGNATPQDWQHHVGHARTAPRSSH